MNTNPSPSGNGLRFSRITSFTVSLCASILVMDAMAADLAALRPAITLQASFDGSADAEFALGDRQIHSAPSMAKPRVGRPGLPSSGVVTLARGEGRFGDALRFHKKVSDMVFFMGEKNMHYLSKNWSGAVSFWLRLSPDEDLEPGYCDPIQITPRDWNDAAFFVEFSKDEKPREFRLGAYADFKIWNPLNRDWNAIPFKEKPLLPVVNPPFKRDRWTHVVFTFERFNTGKANSEAKLYLNGKSQGALTDREQTFTWEPDKVRVMLGLSYVGWMDELALFNRALTEKEVLAIYEATESLKEWGRN